VFCCATALHLRRTDARGGVDLRAGRIRREATARVASTIVNELKLKQFQLQYYWRSYRYINRENAVFCHGLFSISVQLLYEVMTPQLSRLLFLRDLRCNFARKPASRRVFRTFLREAYLWMTRCSCHSWLCRRGCRCKANKADGRKKLGRTIDRKIKMNKL
jgi:hypothetical protein